MFSVALPNSESDLVGLALDQPNVHIHMANILRKSSTGPSDHDNSRLDGDCYAIRYLQFFSFENIAHLPEADVSDDSQWYRVWERHIHRTAIIGPP